MYPEGERIDAKHLASQLGAHHINIEGKEWEIQGLIDNKPDRCYHCKKSYIY